MARKHNRNFIIEPPADRDAGTKKSGIRNPESGIKPGRPEGSVSAPAGIIHAVRPGCIKCKSADLKRERIIRDMDHSVPHPDGVTTHRRRWTRAMCNKCGQWQTIIEDYNA